MSRIKLVAIGSLAGLLTVGAAAIAAPPRPADDRKGTVRSDIHRVQDRVNKGQLTVPMNEANEPDAPPAPAARPNRYIRIETPDAYVRVDPWRGAVRVDAPYAAVDVNPDRGRVRVRAPGVNLDVRW